MRVSRDERPAVDRYPVPSVTVPAAVSPSPAPGHAPGSRIVGGIVVHLVEQQAATDPAIEDADAPLVGARYRLVRLLTADRRRRVHEAWDTRLQRAVALVLVAPAPGTDPGPTLSLAPTAPVHLHRPGLAELYDGGVHDGEVFLVCQRIPGPTLEQRLSTRWTVPELAELARAVARTLAEVHRHGAAHGALTPGRVLLGGPHPVIAECGVADLVEQWSGLADDSPYRAPEQARAAPVPPRTSSRSAGCSSTRRCVAPSPRMRAPCTRWPPG